jgi:DNA-binding beta-propeller fold protein YncE
VASSLTTQNTGLNIGLTFDNLGNLYGTTTQYGCLVTDFSVSQSDCVNDAISSTAYTFIDGYYLASDSQGDLYFDDSQNGDILKLPVGSLTSSTTFASGLDGPSGMVADPSGNLYVYEDGAGGGYLQKFTPDAGVTKLSPVDGGFFVNGGGGGSGLGPAGHQLAIDKYGNIYAAQPAASGILLISPTGQNFLLSSAFNNPVGVAVNWSGTAVYVADTGNSAIKLMTP